MSQMSKDLRPIVQELRLQGWTIETTSQGHFKATPSNKAMPIVHFAVSDDSRSQQNILRDLKRSGFEWPPSRRRREPVAITSEGDSRLYEEIGGEVHLVDVEPLEPPAPPDAFPKPLTDEERMDRAFHELKEARILATLTMEHVRECAARLEKVQNEYNAALQEASDANRALLAKKTEFNQIFEEGTAAA